MKRQDLSQRKTIIGLSGDCRQRLEREEHTQKRALLEAEANAAEATKGAGLEPRELVDRLVAQTSLVGQKDAELVKMQGKLDDSELELSRDQHVRALERAHMAHAADADEYETELGKVCAELEAKKFEQGAIRLTHGRGDWLGQRQNRGFVP